MPAKAAPRANGIALEPLSCQDWLADGMVGSDQYAPGQPVDGADGVDNCVMSVGSWGADPHGGGGGASPA